jgi:hypothetical protein
MIRFIARWTFRLIILGIVLLVAVILLKDQILRSVLESRIRAATGMEARIGSVRTHLMEPVITFKDFVLYNTADFGGGPFLDMPELHMEYSADANGRADLKFKLVRLNLKELNIVESADGRTNITAMAVAMEKLQPANTNQSGIQFSGIDTLNLTVGKVRWISLRRPNRNQEFNLQLRNDVVQNVRSWNDMAGILFKVLLRAGITLYLDPPRTTNAPPAQPVTAPSRR